MTVARDPDDSTHQSHREDDRGGNNAVVPGPLIEIAAADLHQAAAGRALAGAAGACRGRGRSSVASFDAEPLPRDSWGRGVLSSLPRGLCRRIVRSLLIGGTGPQDQRHDD
jgi:hypothetical protein